MEKDEKKPEKLTIFDYYFIYALNGMLSSQPMWATQPEKAIEKAFLAAEIAIEKRNKKFANN